MVLITDIVKAFQQKLDDRGISRDSYIVTIVYKERASLYWPKEHIYCNVFTDDENYIFGQKSKELCFTKEEYDKAVEFICELLSIK